MPSPPRAHVRILLIALATVALAACKQKAAEPLPTELPASPVTVAAADAASIAPAFGAAAAPSFGDFRILRISLGRSLDVGNDIAEERSVFSSRDPVYAAVVTTGSHQGLLLSARWLDGDGKLLVQNDQRLVPDGPMLATFHLNPPHGWPKGHYTLEIALDGTAMQNKSFEVR